MKIIYLLAALMLAPSLATQAIADARTGNGVGLWEPRLCRSVQECILTSARGLLKPRCWPAEGAARTIRHMARLQHRRAIG